MIRFNFALGGKKVELPWYRKAITLLIIRIENSNRLYWSIYSSFDNLISRFTNIMSLFPIQWIKSTPITKDADYCNVSCLLCSFNAYSGTDPHSPIL